MNKKVLIVEDDQLLAYLIETYAINCGVDVIGNVDNGEDAILLAAKELPDYILMDVRIEGDIDGIETAILINEKNDIKIIYISGNSDDQTFSRLDVAPCATAQVRCIAVLNKSACHALCMIDSGQITSARRIFP